MKKLIYMFKEMWFLSKKHKLFFLFPIFFVLILLAFLVYYVGPAAIMSFIYAGI